MCHYQSYDSDAKAKVEDDRRKELQTKRAEVVDRLLQEAEGAARATTPDPADATPVVPASVIPAK